jgi:zinc/manganese transport system substrate-binding protein
MRSTVLLVGVIAALALMGCGAGVKRTPRGEISVVAAENEYGNVAEQIGGRYVSVQSVESDPNTDPHDYEVSPSVAEEVSGAQVLVENGIGYDSWIGKVASASPNAKQQVVNAQNLLGLPITTPNPHLWYSPRTMPVVAQAMARALAKLQPGHAAYFTANVQKFDRSLVPWLQAIRTFKAKYAGTPVATTEPVADYLLGAMGVDNLTPFSLQADIMNGTDPSPQGISNQDALFSRHLVKVFVHNQQVTDPLTETFVTVAQQAKIPVVGVYETMPTGYSYQRWMLAETEAITKAVSDKRSTATL